MVRRVLRTLTLLLLSLLGISKEDKLPPVASSAREWLANIARGLSWVTAAGFGLITENGEERTASETHVLVI